MLRSIPRQEHCSRAAARSSPAAISSATIPCSPPSRPGGEGSPGARPAPSPPTRPPSLPRGGTAGGQHGEGGDAWAGGCFPPRWGIFFCMCGCFYNFDKSSSVTKAPVAVVGAGGGEWGKEGGAELLSPSLSPSPSPSPSLSPSGRTPQHLLPGPLCTTVTAGIRHNFPSQHSSFPPAMTTSVLLRMRQNPTEVVEPGTAPGAEESSSHLSRSSGHPQCLAAETPPSSR